MTWHARFPRTAHLVIGVLSLVAFIGTGTYMDRWHGHLRDYDDATRLLYRSTHIYLLLSALLQVCLGIFWRPATAPARAKLRIAGSVALMAAPALFLAAFAVEPNLKELERPYTRPGVYISALGVALLLASREKEL